jgi:hypothetical protein
VLAQLTEHGQEPSTRTAAKQRQVVVLRLLLLLLHVDQRRVVVVSLDVDQRRVVLWLTTIRVGAAHGGYRGGLVRRSRCTVQWLATAE